MVLWGEVPPYIVGGMSMASRLRSPCARAPFSGCSRHAFHIGFYRSKSTSGDLFWLARFRFLSIGPQGAPKTLPGPSQGHLESVPERSLVLILVTLAPLGSLLHPLWVSLSRPLVCLWVLFALFGRLLGARCILRQPFGVSLGAVCALWASFGSQQASCHI